MKTWKKLYEKKWGVRPPSKLTYQLAKEFRLVETAHTAGTVLSRPQYEQISPLLECLLVSDLTITELMHIRTWLNKEDSVKVDQKNTTVKDPISALEKYKQKGGGSPLILDHDGQVHGAVKSASSVQTVVQPLPAKPLPLVTPPHKQYSGPQYPYSDGGDETTQYKMGFQGSNSSSSVSDNDKRNMRKMPLRPRPYQFETWDFKRTVIVGDLHGCADELVDLLDQIQFKIGEDRLISVGDVVDRGPKISDCFRVLRETKAWMCLGNHEEPFLKWLIFETHPDYKAKFSGKNNPIDLMSRPDQRDTMTQLTHQDWLDMAKMQLFFKLDECKWKPLVVHAGLFPGISKPVEEQDPFGIIRMIRLDDQDATLPFASTTGTNWWEKYEKNPGTHHVVYGHTTSLTGPRSMKYSTGLDTGAVYGGSLSGLVIPPPGTDGSWEIYCVKAKKLHHISSAAELSGGTTAFAGSIKH